MLSKNLKKRLAKLKRNPKHVRFDQLDALLRAAGFTLRGVHGSHYYYKRGKKLITLVKPHGGRKFCAPQDVKDLVRYLEHEVNSHEEEL
uniref:YcfA family protein n=2 Tax=Candidatus Bipolaricaulota TaxID=67810 RepID=H5SG85_9BACT|nr:hypothetical protein HGMM_F23G10C24 [uncultured Acetothermia bacterium]BAL55472.1 hypothetical protein HGMM_F27H04C30 [uncultured Acetothermia bacterium]BAL60212.1 hypothetical conserved protein [Candidatus Acetothermum autotrophicum]